MRRELGQKMISRRDTIVMARLIAKRLMSKQKLDIEVRFVKRTQKRVLKAGFTKLVPNPTPRCELVSPGKYKIYPIKVVLHVRHDWRRMPVHRLIGFLAHELGHVKQMLNHELQQDDKGVITYLDQKYWFHYNVHYGAWLVCIHGTHRSLRRAPWEVALQNLGTMGEFMAIQKKYELKIKGQTFVGEVA